MNYSIHSLPLKIVHAFPYSYGQSTEEKKKAVTDYLNDIKSRGFGGVVTNVSFNNYTEDEEEWKVFSFVSDECERLGLRLWIYDENGYPSGTAGGLTLKENPDYEAVGVVMAKKTIAPNSTLTFELPHGHEYFLYAATYKSENGRISSCQDGSYTPIEEYECFKETAPISIKNETNDTVLALFFIQRRLYEGTHAVHNVWESRRYIDVTNPDAVNAFLNNTYEKYADCIPNRMGAGAALNKVAIGKLEAIFTDEPSLMGCYINKGLYPHSVRDKIDGDFPLFPVLSYGRDVNKEYRGRYGRELFADFASIFLGDSEKAKCIREDYYSLLSDLYEQSYFAKIGKWCEEHGVSFSGHLLLEDDIRYHTVFEGNFFKLLRHMHYPGIDMLSSVPEHLSVGAYAFTSKLVSSIAHLYNRPHVMSEASGLIEGNKVTKDEMYAAVCAQYANGIDIFTYYYDEKNFDPETYSLYNKALGRIDEKMAGRHKAELLLYYPIETLRRHHRPSDAQFGAYSDEETKCKENLWKIMNTLLHYQIDFDFIDYETLSSIMTEDGVFIGANGEKYSALVLPPMDETERMTELFNKLSERVKIIRYCDIEHKTEDEVAEPIISYLDTVRGNFGVLRAECATSGVLRLARDTELGLACLIVNTNKTDCELKYRLYGMKSPTVYNPLTDAPVSAEIKSVADYHEISLSIPARHSLIITEKHN